MVRGFWEDLQYTLRLYGEEAFRNAIQRARPGVFDRPPARKPGQSAA
jgi:hypothetical protein